MILYCGLNSKASTVIHQLIYWDEKRTVRENAKDLKMSKQNALELAKRYGLKYKRSYQTQYSVPSMVINPPLDETGIT